MKKAISLFLVFSIFSLSSIFADGNESEKIPTPLTTQSRAKAASAGSSSAVSMSMVVWGIVGAVGIAALAIAIHHSTSHS